MSFLMDLEHGRPVSWYPGHMLKAQREIRRQLALVDMAVAVLDARAPQCSRNSTVLDIIGDKPLLFVLNKADLADTRVTAAWRRSAAAAGVTTVAVDARQRNVARVVIAGMHTALQRRAAAGAGRRWRRAGRAMVVGMPNVGKSSLINGLRGRRAAKTGPRPGVTRHQQWVRLTDEWELLDTPGIMVPRVEHVEDGYRLGVVAAVKEELLGVERLAAYCLHQLETQQRLSALDAYAMDPLPPTTGELLRTLAGKWGFVRQGGVPDPERAAARLLADFRDGTLGRISLERPESSRHAELTPRRAD